jgi:N-acetylglucosaminyldiphosphoundecaprenol N-acetyl-beta-D-mannosaminyltransferase
MNPLSLPQPVEVLGTHLVPTHYAELIARVQAYPADAPPVTLSFANTQIVSLRRARPEFRKLTVGVDYFIPDGMPLVWCMNRAGAGLEDRVYGPEFMLRAVEQALPRQGHYLLGGSAECGALLREKAARKWPGFNIVGSYHGPCSADGRLGWGREEEERVFAELTRLRPAYIWVGMGEAKQNALLVRLQKRVECGVLLAVGCAFDMLVGLQPNAPRWMQRAGLTWLYRVLHEPRRLAGRYLCYNTLFLCQMMTWWIGEAVKGKPGAGRRH